MIKMVLNWIKDKISGGYLEMAENQIVHEDMLYNDEKNTVQYNVEEGSATLDVMKKPFDGYEITVGNFSVIRKGIEKGIEKYDPEAVIVSADLGEKGWSKEIPMDGDPVEKADTKLGKRYTECAFKEQGDSFLVATEVIEFMKEFDKGEVGEDVIPNNL